MKLSNAANKANTTKSTLAIWPISVLIIAANINTGNAILKTIYDALAVKASSILLRHLRPIPIKTKEKTGKVIDPTKTNCCQ